MLCIPFNLIKSFIRILSVLLLPKLCISSQYLYRYQCTDCIMCMAKDIIQIVIWFRRNLATKTREKNWNLFAFNVFVHSWYSSSSNRQAAPSASTFPGLPPPVFRFETFTSFSRCMIKSSFQIHCDPTHITEFQNCLWSFPTPKRSWKFSSYVRTRNAMIKCDNYM